jgi:hypothetical protein
MDRVARRLADKANALRGILTDTPYADWEGATEAQREFWREIARASQDHGQERGFMGEPPIPDEMVNTTTGEKLKGPKKAKAK